jgi:iron(III) transport system substrate-binding protein
MRVRTDPRRHPRRLLRLALALLVAVPLALGGCGGGETLTVYSGRTENLVGPLLQRFEQDTGVAVDVKYGDSAELALLLAEEGERSPADVFISQSPGATGFLATKDLLGTLQSAELDAVDPHWRNAEGRWVGTTARQRVLVYNTDLVAAADLPDSVFDLTGRAYKGKVAVAPSNGSFQDFVSAMRQLAGEDRARSWLTAMAANDAAVYANNNAIVEAVGRGEIPMGLVNHYYNHRLKAENPSQPTANHVFADGDLGSLAIPSTASVLAGTDQADQARRLVDFLLSRPSQEYFRDETFEYPLAAGVRPSPGLPPLDTAKLARIDIDRLGAELTGTVELIRASGLEGS